MGRADMMVRLLAVAVLGTVVIAATTTTVTTAGDAGARSVASDRPPESSGSARATDAATAPWPGAALPAPADLTWPASPTVRRSAPVRDAPVELAAPVGPDAPVELAVGGRSPSADAIARRASAPLRTLLVAFGGDILNENAVNQAAANAAGPGQRYDFAPLFAPPVAPVAPVIAGVDLAVCHAELPIGAPGERPGVYGRSPFGGNLLLAPYELAPGLAATGFDRCSTASNHSFDLGVPGIVSTLDALDGVGITHTGTARTPEESDQSGGSDAHHLLVVNGVSLSHLAYTRSSNTSPPRDAWMLDRATSVEQVIGDVTAARAAGAELVVVSLHVGTEMQTGPTGGDRDFATRLIAGADVDLVVHHGPHVVQPVELVNGTWVYWSLGNFVSGMGLAHQGRYADQRTLDGLVATVRFTEIETGVFTAESRPVLVCTSRTDRSVHAPVVALGDPVASAAMDPGRRAELQACLDRTRRVQPELF